MPAAHDLDPAAMTDEERRAKRRFEAGFAFETMPPSICSFRWMASRPEVETVPVEHICGESFGHGEVHVCCCGAYTHQR